MGSAMLGESGLPTPNPNATYQPQLSPHLIIPAKIDPFQGLLIEIPLLFHISLKHNRLSMISKLQFLLTEQKIKRYLQSKLCVESTF